MVSLPPITLHKTKTALGEALGVGHKFAAKRPFVVEVFDQKGKRLGFINLRDLFR